MKGSDLFLQATIKHKITNGFGIVGGEAQAIQFNTTGLNFYLTRHEFTAGIMADVYSRITSRPQLCYSTFGPGLTNLSTGVCSAILDRSPMIAVSAQIDRSEVRFNQTHQCIDNVRFMEPITKSALEISSVDAIPDVLERSISAAINGIPGPSYISFPLDVMETEVDAAKGKKILDNVLPVKRVQANPADITQLAKVVKKIDAAVNPIVIVGNQVIREECCDYVRQFIEKVNIPVLTTLASKGAIAADHPLFITPGNKYIDQIYGKRLIDKIFTTSDLIILLGYDFGEDLKPSLWDGKIESIVLNSFYDCMGEVFQPDMLCLGEFKHMLTYLTENIKQPKKIPQHIRDVQSIFSERKVFNLHGGLTNIAYIMQAVRESLGRTGILCSDIGLHKQYAGLLSKTYVPDTFLCSNVCGTFGFGLPAAMAAKLAKPEERVCVICGDGGFHSTSQDLETVVRYNIPIVIVILKDDAFGLIKYYQLKTQDSIHHNSVSFGSVDFVKLAHSNGIHALNLDDLSHFKQILDLAFASNKPLLIEIPVTYKYDLVDAISNSTEKEYEIA